jgi:hypothetical protein
MIFAIQHSFHTIRAIYEFQLACKAKAPKTAQWKFLIVEWDNAGKRSYTKMVLFF